MIKLREDEVQNCTWTVVEVTPEYRRSIGKGTHPVTGLPIIVQRTESLVEPALIDMNRTARNETDSQRWGVGSGSEKRGNVPFIKVASTPLNKWIADHAKAQQEGDDDFGKWWLNRDENQPFRTRNGRI